ncbi:FeoA domain-containing protein [Roseibacillus ishigakijimensis]|nr:FeoA domain-containing protein [Roseibacillus ishigakijimensis]
MKVASPQICDTSTVSLKQAAAGCDLQVELVEGADCNQLRDLGFCEQMRLRKISNGRTLVCSICGSRLAISSHLAEQIQVRQLS